MRNDVIFGGGGDDDVTGGEGHDTICGGSGADRITGAGGEDLSERPVPELRRHRLTPSSC
ncbi:MAG: hypothetical protein ABR540_04700 [Acidimicrobiales bacterium]|nr:hypothetical protein [Actinomycetota bacterium]